MGRCSDFVGSPSFPVALLIFLTGCTLMGTIKSVGIYLEDITEDLGTTSTDLGIALGLFTAFSYMPSPLVAALYRRRPLRRVLMISGSCLAPLGIMLTSIASQKALISVFLSISGLGICLLITSGLVALSDVGSPHFNLIWSICLNGYGVGIMVLPLLAEFLRESYGWRGGLLIMGGLIANSIPCALAVKEATTSSKSQAEIDRPYADAVIDRPSSSMPDLPTKTHYRGEYVNEQANEEDESESETSGTSERELDPFLDRHDESGKTSLSFPKKVLVSFYNSDFYMDPVFNFVFLAVLFQALVYCGWHAFLVPHAFQRGLSIHNILILTFLTSLGSITGRLLIGVFCNNWFAPVSVFQVCTCLNFVAVLCDAFIPKIYVIMVTSCISAGALAGRSVLVGIIGRERASGEKKDVAFAAVFLCYGVGTLLGGYMSGRIAEAYSTYDVVLKLLAGVEVLTFGIMLVPMVFKKPSSRLKQ